MTRKLLDAIKGQEARIGILGLGYVGIPLAQRISEVGFAVLGFDVSQERVDQLSTPE